MRGREAVLAAIALATVLAISISYANVFVYYPIPITASAVQNPVYFATGSNDGKPDISGTITANPGTNGASLTITVHPTYETTYYKNISIVVNSGSNAYYLYLKVDTPMGSPADRAQLCFYQSNGARSLSGFPVPTPGGSGLLQCVNLLSTGTTYITQLNANTKIEVDLLIHIPQGSTLPATLTANAYLVYTPTQETPP